MSNEKAVFVAAQPSRDPRAPKQQLQAASEKSAGVGFALSYPTCTDLGKARWGRGVGSGGRKDSFKHLPRQHGFGSMQVGIQVLFFFY